MEPFKEHDVVQLILDFCGLPPGATGTVVSIYGPEATEVLVEFPDCNVMDVPIAYLIETK